MAQARWTANGWEAPEGFEPDAKQEEPGVVWYKLVGEGADDSNEENWARVVAFSPPEGFAPKEDMPGWYHRVDESADDSNEANWVADATVQDEPAAPSQTDIQVEHVQGLVAGSYRAIPRGVILHGSRSGTQNDTEQEYTGTVGYVSRGTDGTVGWNVTVGDGKYTTHMEPTQYGWHARAASTGYLGAEFAQATRDKPVSDDQVRAFCHWFVNVVQPSWPGIALSFPSHAEVEAQGLTGQRDGKDDVFPNGDPRTEELRTRILAQLGFSAPPAETTGGDEFGLVPNQQFSAQALWPVVLEYAAQYRVLPEQIAGMIQQESTRHNYRVHDDGTGHGLLGLDDNGLAQDFETWSGLSLGRGANANIVPVRPQIEFCAMQIRKFLDKYTDDDSWVGVRAWHAGGTGRNTTRGTSYEQLVRAKFIDFQAAL